MTECIRVEHGKPKCSEAMKDDQYYWCFACKQEAKKDGESKR